MDHYFKCISRKNLKKKIHIFCVEWKCLSALKILFAFILIHHSVKQISDVYLVLDFKQCYFHGFLLFADFLTSDWFWIRMLKSNLIRNQRLYNYFIFWLPVLNNFFTCLKDPLFIVHNKFAYKIESLENKKEKEHWQ